MRRLTRPSARNERGATMVFVAVTVTALFGFAAVGIDLSHTIYERGRIQHAADSAAFAVAYDCVSSDPGRQDECYPDTGQPTVDEFVTAESAGDEGTITNELTPAAGEVVVEVGQNVSHFFARILGIDSSDIQARARVVWEYAEAGKTLPYAVSICQFLTTGYDTPVTLDGTVNQDSGDIKGWKGINETTLGALNTWSSCDDGVVPPPDGVEVPDGARTLRDGLWFSEDNCSNNVSDGGSELVLNEVVCGAAMNTNPVRKYPIEDGETILLAVYAPHENESGGTHSSWEYGGFCADAAGAVAKCPGLANNTTGGTGGSGGKGGGKGGSGGGAGSGGGLSPMFELEIVGFVPFEVMGCRYGQPPYTCGGEDPGAQGLYGQFVTTTEGIPDTEYGPDGTNFGAVKVSLVE